MDNASADEMMIVQREVDGRTVLEFRSMNGRPRCDLDDVDTVIGWLRAARDRRDARATLEPSPVPEQRTAVRERRGRTRTLLSLCGIALRA